jgi:hypothetical protein
LEPLTVRMAQMAQMALTVRVAQVHQAAAHQV